MSSNDRDYEIGYKKPPKGSQFKSGQSGNPKGRQKTKPPIKRNFDTDFRNELGTNNRARVFFFEEGDIFTTTQIDYSGDRAAFANVVVGDYATAHAADGKFTVNSATTAAAVQEFRVIEKTTLNGYNAVVLQCIRTAIS